ncbi:hypothetical protein D9615_002497 [Tricholomella constricta]|uniref:Uncharacterized protein n=1 Tax=Tricholomella constricta TaxID=117010 RepID=A0A8H5HME3_9AGAR|nr:hypothetical protein D9615_002497 [Tricholomella constricta]
MELSWSFLFFSLALVPFTGILARYRLAYHPAADDNITPAPTFLGVISTVHAIEGWHGLSNGLFPTFIVLLLVPVFARNPIILVYPSPPTIDDKLTDFILVNIFYSFAFVWVYRAITTRTNLPLLTTTGTTALAALFTHHEFKKLFPVIYPGVLPALLLISLLDGLARDFIATVMRGIHDSDDQAHEYLRFAALLALLLARPLLLTPLEVVATRMAAQRSYGPDAKPNPALAQSSSDTDADAAPPVEVVSEKATSEKVDLEMGVPAAPLSSELPHEAEKVAVRFRGDDDPYTGILDCARKIIRYEGWGVLYRGWWVTLVRLA